MSTGMIVVLTGIVFFLLTCVALLDIVWFWKKQGFKRRIELLAQVGPQNLIVAVATRLNTDEMIPELDPMRVYPFKGVIHPARIVELAEIHASG